MGKVYIISLRLIIGILICQAGHFQTYAQNPETLKHQFEKWDKVYREKVYCHLDRSVYVSGDNIWIAAYCTNNKGSFYNTKSKVLYIELVNQDNNHVLGKKILLKEGTAKAEISIPDSLSSGIYYIKAYTNWMKNFNPVFHFSKQIFVSNRFGRTTPNVQGNTKDRWNVEFSPEGGNLIYGFKSKTGIKMIGDSVRNTRLKGMLVDDLNNTIDSFQMVNGYGSICFAPQKGKEYFVVFSELGDNVKFQIPDAKENAANISIDREDKDRLELRIRNTEENVSSVRYFIAVYHETQLLYSEYINFGTPESILELTKTDWPGGIIHIALVSDRDGLIADRLFYNNMASDHRLKMNTNKEIYRNREKVTVDITVNGNGDMMKFADLSLSVNRTYNEDYETDKESCPESSVNDNNETVNTNLQAQPYANCNYNERTDNLMLFMTNNCFNYNYLNSIHPQDFSYIIEDKGLTVSGTVKDRRTGKGIENMDVYFSIPDSIPVIQYYTTRENGRFYFLINNYCSDKDVVIQYAENDNLYDAEILVDEKFYYKEHSVPVTHENYIWTDESVIRENIKRFNIMKAYTSSDDEIIQASLTKTKDTKRFYGEPLVKVYTSDYIDLSNFQEISREILPFVKYRKNKKECSLILTNQELNLEFDNPLLLVDGVPVKDYCSISNMGSEQIKRIEIQNNRRVYGDMILDGVLAIFTYNGKMGGILTIDNGIRKTIQTYECNRSFNSPDYSIDSVYTSSVPDFRDLLFWKPDIKLNSDNTISLSFYTSDEVGKYALKIEGIDEDEKKVCLTRKITVTNE